MAEEEDEEGQHSVWLSTWGPWGIYPSGETRNFVIRTQQGSMVLEAIAKTLGDLSTVVLTIDAEGYATAVATAMSGLAPVERVAAWSTGMHFFGLDSVQSSHHRPLVETPTDAPQHAGAEEAARSFASIARAAHLVEAVYWSEAGGIVRIWTVLDEYDRETEERVYAAEAGILDRFPNLRLAFRILYCHGGRVEEVRPAGASIV